MHNPNYKNLLKVLDRQKPDRFTVFEFFMNRRLYEKVSGKSFSDTEGKDKVEALKIIVDAFYNMGYDYATIEIESAMFHTGKVHKKSSISQNENPTIIDWDSFKNYQWPDLDSLDEYSNLNKLESYMPEGMKVVACGNQGVLEALVELFGFDNLCYKIYDDPKLVHAVVDRIGSTIVRHYQILGKKDIVCAMISNDDWGFNMQTILSVKHMRELIFPWHKKIVKAIHESNRPAILHSCGNPKYIMEDVIEMGYDGRHSYEDKIYPVEQFYADFHDKIAVLGGIDVDFIIRQDKKKVYDRAYDMLKQSEKYGSYALGTGNSVPEYVPDENFLNLIAAATDNR